MTKIWKAAVHKKFLKKTEAGCLALICFFSNEVNCTNIIENDLTRPTKSCKIAPKGHP